MTCMGLFEGKVLKHSKIKYSLSLPPKWNTVDKDPGYDPEHTLQGVNAMEINSQQDLSHIYMEVILTTFNKCV